MHSDSVTYSHHSWASFSFCSLGRACCRTGRSWRWRTPATSPSSPTTRSRRGSSGTSANLEGQWNSHDRMFEVKPHYWWIHASVISYCWFKVLVLQWSLHAWYAYCLVILDLLVEMFRIYMHIIKKFRFCDGNTRWLCQPVFNIQGGFIGWNGLNIIPSS